MNHVHCMLDIETADNRDTAAVLSAAAVFFTREGVVNCIDANFDPQKQLDLGRTIGASTLRWWMKQSEAARLAAFCPDRTQEYSDFYRNLCDSIQSFAQLNSTVICPVWGNGSDFDNVILRSAAKSLGIQRSWNYRGNRCFRTLTSVLDPKKEHFAPSGTAHNALDDAVAQAEWLVKLDSLFPDLHIMG